MPARQVRLRTTAAHDGMRLDHVLREALGATLGTAPSNAFVRRLIMAGAVRVNGVALRAPGRPLRPGRLVEANVETAQLLPPPRAFDVVVLYEDEAVLAVDKPPALQMHATADPRRPSLVSLLEAHRPRLGVHQRLDRDTSGIVLFSKGPEASRGLARQFEARAIEKTYLALTVRPRELPPRSWRAEGRLALVGKGRMARTPDGALAETDFVRLEILAGGLVVEARPRTGRKHQIRAQLAEAGLPILGDVTYGAPDDRSVPRVMLHALGLAFDHPLTGARMRLECPIPADFRAARAALAARQKRRR